jgi:thiol-disulfide isomerase/thioredoxin
MLAAVIVLGWGWQRADPLISVVLAVMIFWSAWKLVVRTAGVLMEGTPAGLHPPDLERTIRSTPGVGDLHDLHAWRISDGFDVVTVHVILDGTRHGPEVAQEVCARVRATHGIEHVTVQPEPPPARVVVPLSGLRPPRLTASAPHAAAGRRCWRCGLGASRSASFARRCSWPVWARWMSLTPIRNVEDRPPAPSFGLANASGKLVQLSSFRGQPVVLNLWATDCGGCKVELPAFVRMDHRYKGKGLAVIGVSFDIMYADLKDATEGWARVRPFVEAKGSRIRSCSTTGRWEERSKSPHFRRRIS